MVLREEVPGIVEGELFYENEPEYTPAGALKGTRVGDIVELEGVGVKLVGAKLTATKLKGTLEYQGIPPDPEVLRTPVELTR
jgi:hypothetical protein